MSGVTSLFTITNVCSDAGKGFVQFRPSPPSVRLKLSLAAVSGVFMSPWTSAALSARFYTLISSICPAKYWP